MESGSATSRDGLQREGLVVRPDVSHGTSLEYRGILRGYTSGNSARRDTAMRDRHVSNELLHRQAGLAGFSGRRPSHRAEGRMRRHRYRGVHVKKRMLPLIEFSRRGHEKRHRQRDPGTALPRSKELPMPSLSGKARTLHLPCHCFECQHLDPVPIHPMRNVEQMREWVLVFTSRGPSSGKVHPSSRARLLKRSGGPCG